MEAKELKLKDVMCGDWVFIKDYPIRALPQMVIPEYFLRNLMEFEPISLSRSILERLGFDVSVIPDYDDVEEEVFYKAVCRCKDNRGCDVEIEYRTDRNEIHVISHDCKNVLPIRQVCTQIRFVHELQHLFVLLGIEKEVAL